MARGGPSAASLQPSAVPNLAVGDSNGGIWIVGKDLASDAHHVTRTTLPDTLNTDRISSLVWREPALVVGTGSGVIIAVDVGQGVLFPCCCLIQYDNFLQMVC